MFYLAPKDAFPMDERSQRIIDVAMELAERDGYDAVRLRDLADQAGVALATVYRRFSCKEDILAAALDQQVQVAAEMLRGQPLPGDTPTERLDWFFRLTTEALAEQPKLSAAMLRTVASGVPDLAERVTRYHGHMTELILGVYRGGFSQEFPSEEERMLAVLLQDVWFGALVGWTGGMLSPEEVLEQTSVATRWLLAGMKEQR
jgi:AcrR family transcriptional regulator